MTRFWNICSNNDHWRICGNLCFFNLWHTGLGFAPRSSFHSGVTLCVHARVSRPCLLSCMSPDVAPGLECACPSSEPDAPTCSLSSVGATHRQNNVSDDHIKCCTEIRCWDVYSAPFFTCSCGGGRTGRMLYPLSRDWLTSHCWHGPTHTHAHTRTHVHTQTIHTSATLQVVQIYDIALSYRASKENSQLYDCFPDFCVCMCVYTYLNSLLQGQYGLFFFL